MTELQYIELLDWDTKFFGFQVARLAGDVVIADVETIRAIEAECASHRVRCLYALVDLTDIQTSRTVDLAAGFELVDIRVTFERRIVAGACFETSSDIRLATDADAASLCAVAADSYTDSRFFFDPRFPDECCRELYQLWMEKSINGTLADAVVVIDQDDTAAAFVTCSVEGRSGRIGLVGVAPDHRGEGLGTAAVRCALRWFADHGVSRIEVATQGRNISAQRLYQSVGFKTSRAQASYHRWFSP